MDEQPREPGPVVFAPPEDASLSDLPPRCRRCGYILEGSVHPSCPECGQGFDPHNEDTFDRRPPFAFWRYWLPGVWLGVGLGFFSIALLALSGSWGWVLLVCLPLTLGSVLGYGLNVGRTLLFVAGLLLLFGLVISLFSVNVTGMVCSVILGMIWLLPILLGLVVGRSLRATMKRRDDFDQRHYLPLLIVALTLLGFVEKWAGSGLAPRQIVTSAVVPMGAQEAFDRIVFYEDAAGTPPAAAHWLLPRPVTSSGRADRVGATRTCVYTRGHLTKRVTAIEQGRLLSFEVIEQKKFETRSARLIGGSFRFQPVGAGRTRITLTTEYEPLLQARPIWRPFEDAVARGVHEHVLAAIAGEPVELHAADGAQP